MTPKARSPRLKPGTTKRATPLVLVCFEGVAEVAEAGVVIATLVTVDGLPVATMRLEDSEVAEVVGVAGVVELLNGEGGALLLGVGLAVMVVETEALEPAGAEEAGEEAGAAEEDGDTTAGTEDEEEPAGGVGATEAELEAGATEELGATTGLVEQLLAD